jgi:PilZ domain
MQQSGLQRRKYERNPVKANAFVHCRGQFQCAKVIDFSPHGLQLAGTFGLMKHDSIQIEFVSGSRIRGKVAWSQGSYVGVTFFEPLAGTHPAVIELARRAAKTLCRFSLHVA